MPGFGVHKLCLLLEIYLRFQNLDKDIILYLLELQKYT